MPQNNLPNFLIVGAGKSGTTSLYYYLKQHPEIFLSDNKEPWFLGIANNKNINLNHLSSSIIFDYDKYIKLFNRSSGYKIIGEASTIYLYLYKNAINNIKKYLPNYYETKIIIILRNPIDRAYSHYKHYKRNYRENMMFEKIIEFENKEETEVNEKSFDFHYIKQGFYYRQVKSYLENFKNVKIIIFDEFINNTEKTLIEIFNFLNINNKFIPSFTKKYNISGAPRNKLLNKLTFGNYKLKKIIKFILPYYIQDELVRIITKYNLKKINLDNNTRKKLINIYKKDILKLEKLIEKDLSSWLK